MDGERLSDDLLNFAENTRQKRLEYFEYALTIPLENIRYETLSVKRGILEDADESFSSEDEIHTEDSESDD